MVLGLPVSVLKHLKLLSQNPHTNMMSLPGRAVKQAAEGERLWSRGSPSLTFRPLAAWKVVVEIIIIIIPSTIAVAIAGY